MSTSDKMKRFCFLVAGNVIVCALLLFTIEGLSRYMLLVHDLIVTNLIPERRHTKYDPNLGWVNESGLSLPNLYGPGIHFTTNAQGFRNTHDIGVDVPLGQSRVICSGDSFTLGYGVNDDEAWCHILTSLDQRLETVNMGQGGYGVDQAYLWYKRDGVKINHQIHILAFITEDFYRMQSTRFDGYGKPILDIADGALVVKNVPVPKPAYYFPRFAQNISNIESLSTFTVMRRAFQTIGITAGGPPPTAGANREHTEAVLRKVFKDLKRINEERSSTFVLIYLPVIDELTNDKEPRDWIGFLEEESRSDHIPFLNVFAAFESLPRNEMSRLFLPDGHYSVAGHKLVAGVIYDKLVEDRLVTPVIAARRG